MDAATSTWLEMDSSPNRHPSPPLRVGFVPLVHAAPLLAASALGLFEQHGLRVRLSREVGWATIREKILSGELDAAQALAPMPLAMSLGLNSAPADCLTALVLNNHGDTVILTRRLWRETQGDPKDLLASRSRSDAPLTFGIVYPHSAQSYLLRRWLTGAGLVADRDFRLVVVPPQQTVHHLKAGHLDGCCVGEPWGSLAVRSGVGVIAALSADLAPGHPEKVLLVRASFHQRHPDLHAALVRALLEACAWCADPANQPSMIALLAGAQGIDASAEVIAPSVTGEFNLGENRSESRPDALVFHGSRVNAPTLDCAAWAAQCLGVTATSERLEAVYRHDLHLEFTRPIPLHNAVDSPGLHLLQD
jgi:ABC-type nitrate/sulfonate/bicarbonate transport system substrate-binding protein